MYFFLSGMELKFPGQTQRLILLAEIFAGVNVKCISISSSALDAGGILVDIRIHKSMHVHKYLNSL
jgi:hypothetical protein